MSVVLDASALLVFVKGEAGADVVEAHLEAGALCGAANWSGVAQKIRAAGGSWDLAGALLTSYDLTIDPVTTQDAEWAAARWRKGEGLSLADRLCLALTDRQETQVFTADTAWGSSEPVHQIR